ncbi:MAG: PEGA domain-containing protein [Spirochaetaceae bacterium]|jgi:hypothetical protein|nr:PEGA domain-containing protein [Spirochaetaceae bacterium]
MGNYRTSAVVLCLFVLVSFSTAPLFAFGKGDTEKKELQEKNWMICLTDFDASELPPSQTVTSRVIMRQLINHLNGLDYKLRTTKEYDYYWTAAWLSAQSQIAKQIADKQSARDKLIFAGYTDWRYNQEKDKIDAEIELLRGQLDAVELTSPAISTIPIFTLAEENLTGTFPDPPAKSGEYFFCTAHKVNGFLSGKVSLYHDRFLVEVQLWTVWTRSYSYKDSIVFSIEDIDLALGEFASKLINSISGMESAELLVRAMPENAAIIVDDQFASDKGKTKTIQRTPGPVEITVYAEDYVPATETIELNEGEHTDMTFDLTPIPTGAYTIDTKTGEQASVYKGSEYAGTTPLTLTGPLGDYGQVSVQTEDDRSEQTIFQIVDNSKIILDPKIPPASDRIEKARKGFYGAFGRFWIGFPIAYILWSISGTFIATYNANPTVAQYDHAYAWNYVSVGAWIGFGILLTDVLVRFAIYIYQGNRPGAILPPKPRPVTDPMIIGE